MEIQPPEGQLAVGAVSAASLRLDLCEWVETHRPTTGPQAVSAWLEQLQEGASFWNGLGGQLSSAVDRQIAAVVGIVRRIDRSPPPSPPEPLQQWLAFAREVQEQQGADGYDWRRLVVRLSRHGNLLVDGVIAEVLSVGMQQSRLDRTTRVALAPLLKSALAWCKTCPLPPSPGRAVRAQDYVLLYADAPGCESLDGTLNLIVERTGSVRTEVTQLAATSGERGILTAFDARRHDVLSAREQLGGILRSALEGWPVEIPVLQKALEALRSALAGLGEAARRLPVGMQEELQGLVQHWQETSHGLSAVLSPSCEIDSQAPPSAAAAEAPAIDSHPGGAAARWHQQIAALVDEWRGSALPAGATFVPRLTELAAAWQAAEETAAPASWAAALRQLVGCLITLDDQIALGQRVRGLDAVRRRLQAILAEEGSCQLLDETLIGCDLAAQSDRVEACGLVASKDVKHGRIASVQRPGYAVWDEAGGWVVIRKAQVLVAR